MNEAALRTVVAYTETDEGQDALAFATRLARVADAKIDLITVLPSEERATIVPGDPGFAQNLETQVGGWLSQAAKRVGPGIKVKPRIVYAPSSADGLMSYGEQLHADLIIIGARATGVMGRFTLGGVANDLLHASPVPVALVPRGTRLIESERGLTRVTILADKLQGSVEAFRVAEAVATRAGVPIRIVTLATRGFPKHDPEGATDADRSAAGEALRPLIERLTAAGTPVEHVLASGRDVPQALATITWLSDEIAMVGSSRLAPPRRLFLGSTAGKIAREVPVPLVVMHRDNA